jgi:GT2 family glycosyltransferase/glycosyltransferase involved in cell wall biosynthesis
VILVDDGSDAQCATYLREFAHDHPHCSLLRNEEPSGYTKAANRGLRETTAELVVLLNSDTIVTPFWLERLVECARSDSEIGLVGPLSNAASYQSVPERFDPNGDWALNALPPGWGIDQLAAAVTQVSNRTFPRVPFVNGFCFAIKRAVVDAIGFFDEEGFPHGYGEENDYCLRAADAGFTLAIADHAYVHHAKSRSYSHERRRDLGKIGRSVLIRKYGAERLEAGEALLRDEPTLAKMRLALGGYLKAAKPAQGTVNEMSATPKVLFLLPVSGGGGGAHSVVQEAAGMRRLGVEAQVAIRSRHLPLYRENYPATGGAERLFFSYRTLDELVTHAAGFDVVVATIHTSMPLVAAIAAEHTSVIPAYYIQDYEPFFYPKGSPEREEAARSYTLVPDAILFAKTRWLCDTVGALHGVEVHKVSPSIDHEVYFPKSTKRQGSRVRVVAMIRPSSPRRGAGRTMEILRQLTREFGRRVDVRTFGCTEADLDGAQLPTDFPFTNHGILTREQVAKLLRDADIFIDLSDYQAFGRTGLEAMACGCAVVVPALGGTDEYAVDRENALIVDTSQLEDCFAAARELMADAKLRERLKQSGVAKASEFSIDRAARSELEVFKGVLVTPPSLIEANPTAAVLA